MKFEDPIQFEINKMEGAIEIVYSNLMEICQGGPEVGNLSINGKTVDGNFGGPAIFHEQYIYIPVYIKKNFRTGFKLARINTETFDIEHLGKIKDLIFLNKVEGNRIYFFEDLNKTLLKYYEL